MTLITDLFDRADNASNLGTDWNTFTTNASQSNGWRVTTGTARAASTSTSIARHKTLPTGADCFVQARVAANVGQSMLFLRGTGTASADQGGYLLIHDGTTLSIKSLGAGNAALETTIGSIAHTRAVGQVHRLVAQGSTLTAYVDGVQVLTGPSTAYPGVGTLGIRAGAVAGVSFDDFYGGDLADMSAAPLSGAAPGGTVPPAVTESVNVPNAGLTPPWRGLIHDLSGHPVLAGEEAHRLRAEFLGVAGTYTPPAWLAVAEGAATLEGAGGGRLKLTTAAAAAARATLRLAEALATTEHAAVRIDLVALCAANAAMDVRLFAGDAVVGAQAVQLAAMPTMALTSQSENNRTKCHTASVLAAPTARRALGLLVSFATKEAWLLERDMVIGYRDCASTWTDGPAPVGISVTATTATPAELRLASMAVTTYV